MQAAIDAGWAVDTVGVRNITEADTINLDTGLTIVETTRSFPMSARGGEVFAWEFYAETLNPVKLLILAPAEDRGFELVGESPLVVPPRPGVHRIALPEPIPVDFRYKFAIFMPEASSVPFRKVLNWKTLIRQSPFERPYTAREGFSMYGWRYAVRVFWRKAAPPEVTL
ncbi:MAG: hypothetical protein VX733_06275 [Candidatus Latescibacterota bacterium]|nr:hypothetical protein [Candidatus Latescibacterota bacterium]